jgi:hypothetical protein
MNAESNAERYGRIRGDDATGTGRRQRASWKQASELKISDISCSGRFDQVSADSRLL